MNRTTALPLVLGGWIIGTLAMWLVATQNFATVERILAAPPHAATSMAEPLAAGDLRELLRYEASELNRFYFNVWGYAQLPLAAVAVWLAWPMGKFLRGGAVGAAVIALGLQLYVVPGTIRLGREIDFQPSTPETAQQAAFWRLHHAYTGLDMVKFLTLAGCAVTVLRKR